MNLKDVKKEIKQINNSLIKCKFNEVNWEFIPPDDKNEASRSVIVTFKTGQYENIRFVIPFKFKDFIFSLRKYFLYIGDDEMARVICPSWFHRWRIWRNINKVMSDVQNIKAVNSVRKIYDK